MSTKLKFESVYNEYWPKVFRLCMGYVNDEARAKDICQDTFIAILNALPNFRNESAVGTWIFRIASNQCLKEIAKESKLDTQEIQCDIAAEANDKSIDVKMELMYQCISELPEIDRIIISLELEDIKQEEIANIVGISPSNARVKIHRIKQKLTKKLIEYGSK